MSRLALSVVVLALGVLAMARPLAAQPQPYAAINAEVVSAHVLPALSRFSAAGTALARAFAAPDTEPSAKRLTALRAAYHAASDAWQAVQHLRRGPGEAEFRHQRMQFWPDKRGHTARHLRRLLGAADPAALAPAALAKGSVAVQGLPALERLLFGKSPPSGFAFQAAQAIAGNIAAIAAALQRDWRNTANGFGALLAKPGPTNPMFTDDKAVTAFMLTELITGVKALAELKLRRVVARGDKPARPKLAENWRSRRSLADIRINLGALRDLFGAITRKAELVGEDRQQRDFIDDQFAALIADAARLGPSLVAAIERDNGMAEVRGLAAGIEDIHELCVEFLTEALQLTLGFNGLDGD